MARLALQRGQRRLSLTSVVIPVFGMLRNG